MHHHHTGIEVQLLLASACRILRVVALQSRCYHSLPLTELSEEAISRTSCLE